MMRMRASGWRRRSPWQRAFDWISLGDHHDNRRLWAAAEAALAFVSEWYHTRPRQLLLGSVPALVACGWGVFVGGEATGLSKERRVQEYEQRAEQLRQTGDQEGRELCLRALAELEARNPSHRLQLGLLLASTGRRDAAREQMQLAAAKQDTGAADACLWLARDRLHRGADAGSAGEAERLLLQALRTEPRNPAVRLELAGFYELRGELLLAERSLAELAAADPLRYPALLQWLLRLGRPGDRIRQVIRQSVQALEDQLRENPGNEAARIALSEVYVVDGDFAAGERTLRGADRSRELSGAMRGAWSSLRLLQARSLLLKSPLNRDAALPLLAESLTHDPRYIEALELAEALSGGLRFPAEALNTPLKRLREHRAAGGDDWETAWIFCRLQLLAGRTPEEVPEPAVGDLRDRVSLRRRLQHAALLQRCGRSEDSLEATEQLLSELQAYPELDPGRLFAAECLLLLGQGTEALRLLQREEAVEEGKASKTLQAASRSLLARGSLAAFDERLPQMASGSGDSGHADPAELLRPAFEDPGYAFAALERLCRLSTGDSAAAAAAGSLLSRLRSEGRYLAEIPSMLGVQAVQQGRFTEAVLLLREADAAARHRDAAIRNNLAVSLVREDAAQAEEALELIDAALEQQPGHPDLLATQGEVCAAMGMWQEAVESFTAALPSRRGDEELQRLLEQASLSLRDQQRSDRLKRAGSRRQQQLFREPQQER